MKVSKIKPNLSMIKVKNNQTVLFLIIAISYVALNLITMGFFGRNLNIDTLIVFSPTLFLYLLAHVFFYCNFCWISKAY